MTIDLLTRSEIADDATRREFLAGLAATGLLVACGDRDQGRREAGGTDTINVEHPGGTTEVPVAPQRIVTLDGFVDLQTLLALGVDPVLAGVDPGLADGLLAGRLASVGEIADRGVENLERIAAARPDLIVGAEYDVDRYGDLSAIAPTILIDRYGDTVDEHLRILGRVVGLEDEAEAAIARFEQRLREVAEIVSASPLSERVVGAVSREIFDGTVSAYGPRSYGGRTLVAVGAELLEPGGVSDGEDFAFGSDLSVEQLGFLEPADLIISYVSSPSPDNADSIEAQALWGVLPAVAAGGVVEVDSDVWYQDTALSRMARLDDIERIVGDLR